MRIPWNIVTKNFSPGDARLPLEKKLQQKIAKFDRYLAHFPPDAVHLQIVLEKHPRKDRYLASLTLRVPSDILHSEEAGRDLIGAFDAAVKSLLRKLKSYKSSLHSEKFWKRKERREKLHALKATGFAFEPQEKGEGPQKSEDVVRELFNQRYKEFLRHVRRHIVHDERTGDLPKDAVKARDVLNEVLRRALAKADKGPKRGGWLTSFYQLIHEELLRQRRRWKQKKPGPTKGPAERAPTAAESVRAEVPPVDIAARKDVVAQLEQDMRNWPRQERDVFELYYVEGLDPEEIAMVTQQPLKTVRANLESIQHRLRDEMLAQKAAA
ncbi:MAG TPA: HPF/RaiA family ribosome-associated protein [Chthoniobacterales bacterium]|jgi:ribosomal subunit interface protein|nr:HPF/RaiA family ribosome-associated protein [Chthoniobacterales bacterium]